MTRAIALILTVFTGFSGLVYEVAWQKYLATLLGSHSEATAAVLGIFLGGLSLGYSLFGGVTRRLMASAQRAQRPPRLLLLYGVVEAAIGVWALAFPLLFRGVQALSIALPLAGDGAFAVDVALAALLIGPPTVLMGGTIPILTQALARGLSDATRFHAFVYASNTAGAFAGALCAGFFLVPWLGLAAVVERMGLVNLVAGSLFVALGLWRRAVAPPASGSEAGALPRGFAAYAGVALLSGFAMMAIQTVLNRIGALSFGASQFTFSMVVAVFVLCIALGSFAVSALPRIRPSYLVGSQWLLVALLALLSFGLQDGPYWAHVLRSLFRDNGAAFYPYYAAAFLCILVLLALPVGLSGATLPLLFHHLRHEVGDLGMVAGRLYSWNTVGSLLGALVGGYLLLLWLDLTHVYRISLAALSLGATILTARVYRLSWPAMGALVLVPLFAALAALPAWNQERLSAGLFRNRAPLPNTYRGPDAFFSYESAIRFYDDDPSASVAVKESRQGNVLARSIHNNGKSDGAIPADYPTMALVTLIPSLLAESHARGFVIGYGTGVTVGELAALPGTREVVVAEISRGVVEAAPLFDYGNQQASRNPKVRIVRSDAYRALLRSEGQYDVIASEPSNPWVTGVEMLFSREFLQAAKSRLAPGGVYAQWFHVYETDREAVALVLRTYASVFDHVAVWYGIGPDLLLLAFNDPARALDLERIEARAAQPAYAAGLRRGGVRSFAALLAHELLPLDVLGAMALEGPVHTLLHPILSHDAAQAFFRGGSVEMPPSAGARAARVGQENSLLRRWLARRGGVFDEDERGAFVSEMCLHRPLECTAVVGECRQQDPGAPGLAATLAALEGSPAFARHLTPAVLDTLEQLYAGPAPADSAPHGVEAAQQATLLFQRYYTHAAPFSRAALLDAWQRCRDGQARQGSGRCRGGLQAAERSLGPLADASDAATTARRAR